MVPTLSPVSSRMPFCSCRPRWVTARLIKMRFCPPPVLSRTSLDLCILRSRVSYPIAKLKDTIQLQWEVSFGENWTTYTLWEAGRCALERKAEEIPARTEHTYALCVIDRLDLGLFSFWRREDPSALPASSWIQPLTRPVPNERKLSVIPSETTTLKSRP